MRKVDTYQICALNKLTMILANVTPIVYKPANLYYILKQ